MLSASGGLEGTIEPYAAGEVDPRPLVAATVGLDDLPGRLRGRAAARCGTGPKMHIDVQKERRA